MKKLDEFLVIKESLDSVADFYMTSDTEIPNRIVAAMPWEDANYVLNLEKSTKEGLYTMSLGMVVSKNLGYFRFKNTSHIRTILNTTMKALEASVPFLGSNIKAIAISLPSKVSKSYLALMKLLIQKTYLKNNFEFLPVEHVGASHQYLLLIRKGTNPVFIFKTKTFKDYGFNDKYTKATPVPTDALDSLGPLKPHGATYNITPSKRYMYKDYDVDNVTIDNIHHVMAAKPVINKKKTDVDTVLTEPEKEAVVPVKAAPTEHEIKKVSENKVKQHQITTNNIAKGKKHVLFPKEISNDDMKYFENLLAQAIGETILIGITSKEHAKQWMHALGDFDKQKSTLLMLCDLEFQKNILNKLPYIDTAAKIHIFKSCTEIKISGMFTNGNMTQENLDWIMEWAYYRFKTYMFSEEQGEMYDFAMGTSIYKKKEPVKPKQNSNKEQTEIVSHDAVDIDIDLPVLDSQSTFLASFDSNNPTTVYSHGKILEKIQENDSYKAINKQLKSEEKTAVKGYTDGYYSGLNGALRNAYKSESGELKFGDYSGDTYKPILKNLASAFTAIPPIEHGLWVIRNTSVPDITLPDGAHKINEEFVDAGFLSTSIKHGTFESGDDNTQFIIYIPKGSKVICSVDNNTSDHGSEREVILPAFSVLRPIDIKVTKKTQYGQSQYKQFITCVYMGNAMNSYLDKNLKEEYMRIKSFGEFIMTEAKKPFEYPKGYDPKAEYNSQKIGDKMGDSKTAKKILADIKSGKLKIEK